MTDLCKPILLYHNLEVSSWMTLLLVRTDLCNSILLYHYLEVSSWVTLLLVMMVKLGLISVNQPQWDLLTPILGLAEKRKKKFINCQKYTL